MGVSCARRDGLGDAVHFDLTPADPCRRERKRTSTGRASVGVQRQAQEHTRVCVSCGRQTAFERNGRARLRASDSAARQPASRTFRRSACPPECPARRRHASCARRSTVQQAQPSPQRQWARARGRRRPSETGTGEAQTARSLPARLWFRAAPSARRQLIATRSGRLLTFFPSALRPPPLSSRSASERIACGGGAPVQRAVTASGGERGGGGWGEEGGERGRGNEGRGTNEGEARQQLVVFELAKRLGDGLLGLLLRLAVELDACHCGTEERAAQRSVEGGCVGVDTCMACWRGKGPACALGQGRGRRRAAPCAGGQWLRTRCSGV